MTIETTSREQTEPDGPPEVAPGALFSAVVGDGLEKWRVVVVLGIRVLAERLPGGERRSFTLRFVRHRLELRDEQRIDSDAADQA